MSRRLKGKLALITGAGSGLGKATAEHMVEEGARVAATDIDFESAKATADGINKEHPGAAIALQHDVTDDEAWTRVVAEVDEAFGGLNILVNNAGISIHGNIESLSKSNFRKLMDIDLYSVFLGCQSALPLLARTGAASIINVSSVAGILASPNSVGYGTAKAGVCQMTKSIALDCTQKNYDIRCNSIHPTLIETPLIEQFLSSPEDLQRMHDRIPIGRICKPRDVTYPMIFLASDESAMMTGSEVVIDGGLSCGYVPKPVSGAK